MQPKPQLIVLVGEDWLTGTLVALLEKVGYRVSQAGSSGEASRLIQQDRPALVVDERQGLPVPVVPPSVSWRRGTSRLDVPLLDVVRMKKDPVS